MKHLACERQTFLLAYRRWGTFREEERTFLLAQRPSAALSEKKRLPLVGYDNRRVTTSSIVKSTTAWT